MKSLKPLPIKRLNKQGREQKVLLGLVDHYIQTGKPVGSNTLKDAGFGDLSSATIRNYFANLEEEGYLSQSHSSGGRIPTDKAFRAYAQDYIDSPQLPLPEIQEFNSLQDFQSREIARYLQQAAESLASACNCAVFLSAPRFDHDYIIDIKLVSLDAFRCLSILISDFGVIQTEILHLPAKLSTFALKRIESYFHWRLTGIGMPDNLEPEEEKIGKTFYNELMVRYIVGYSNFVDEDIYRTGFSRLLTYADFQDASKLSGGLSLFENGHSMRLLLRECQALNQVKTWIGSDLIHYAGINPNCAVLSIPYYINQHPIGAVGLLCPIRTPYRTLFGILQHFSNCISEALTRNVYKFKISFRHPETGKQYLQKEEHRLIGQSRLILLENKKQSDEP